MESADELLRHLQVPGKVDASVRFEGLLEKQAGLVAISRRVPLGEHLRVPVAHLRPLELVGKLVRLTK